MIPKECKRLAEVDFPIAEVSRHSARQKSIRHGHLSTLRLIEVKSLADATGTILLTPNERRVAEDRRGYYWLYVVTDCAAQPTLRKPIRDLARFPWHEVTKLAPYWLRVNAMTRPMQVREDETSYRKGTVHE